MSQATISDDPGASSAAAQTGQSQEFSYKPVPVIAPVAAFFGFASLFALVSEFAVLITLIGIVVGATAVWTIRRSHGELGGRMWAYIGLFGSLILFVTGLTKHVYAYATEVPDGYHRVSFSRDISAKQFVAANGRRQLHPDVAPLKDQKIFIKGYMYNTQKQTGLTGFTLLKDNGQCCFGGNPKPYDMIVVDMQNGKTVDKIDGLVSVAGVLRCNPQSPGAVYRLEAVYVAPARTKW